MSEIYTRSGDLEATGSISVMTAEHKLHPLSLLAAHERVDRLPQYCAKTSDIERSVQAYWWLGRKRAR